MATTIFTHDVTIPQPLVEDLLIDANPDLIYQPDVFTRALAAQLQPALQDLIAAYQRAYAMASVCSSTERAFHLFVANMVE